MKPGVWHAVQGFGPNFQFAYTPASTPPNLAPFCKSILYTEPRRSETSKSLKATQMEDILESQPLVCLFFALC